MNCGFNFLFLLQCYMDHRVPRLIHSMSIHHCPPQSGRYSTFRMGFWQRGTHGQEHLSIFWNNASHQGQIAPVWTPGPCLCFFNLPSSWSSMALTNLRSGDEVWMTWTLHHDRAAIIVLLTNLFLFRRGDTKPTVVIAALTIEWKCSIDRVSGRTDPAGISIEWWSPTPWISSSWEVHECGAGLCLCHQRHGQISWNWKGSFESWSGSRDSDCSNTFRDWEGGRRVGASRQLVMIIDKSWRVAVTLY